jgi:uncharacterized protein YcbK (DUF882 family)
MRDVTSIWSRRRMLASSAAVSAVALLPAVGWCRPAERRLKFRNMHTDERLDVVYYRDGRYQPGALLEIDHMFRDWRENRPIRIDHRLLDFMHDVHVELGVFDEWELLCGHRTRRTNEMLRRRSGGVARNSLHIVGKAADLSLPAAPLSRTRRAALDLAKGGVGYYPRSDFVHLDTGPVRAWGG